MPRWLRPSSPLLNIVSDLDHEASARILGSFLLPIPQYVNFPRRVNKLISAKDTLN